ncbi:hypothetical protein J6P92_07110 [bacterium]|nr:hypothetical protein [bacterium]
MMKKIILITALLVSGTVGFSANCEYNCVEPYDLSSSASRFFSTLTGQKFLAEKMGERLIKKVVKSNIISGNIKTKIDSFSAKDLKAGRFKSIEITGKDVNIQGIQVSSFSAKTLCNFNYITENKNGDILVKEDMPVKISAVITEENLNNTMQSSNYKRFVDNINNLGGNFNIFKINSTTAKIKNNKMHYIVNYSIPFVRKTKDVVLSADLKVENGEIIFANTTFENNSLSIDADKFSRILNYINPLDFSAQILENRDTKFKIENVNISDNMINVDGTMVVLKDKE